MTDVEAQEHFDNFFEEVFTEIEDKVMLWILTELPTCVPLVLFGP